MDWESIDNRVVEEKAQGEEHVALREDEQRWLLDQLVKEGCLSVIKTKEGETGWNGTAKGRLMWAVLDVQRRAELGLPPGDEEFVIHVPANIRELLTSLQVEEPNDTTQH